MKRLLLSVFAVALFQISLAQFSGSGLSITDNLNTFNQSQDHKLGKKAAGSNKSCNGDTLDYGRYKASALVGINISNGYRLGQMYDAPGEVTISGFDFYAWQNMRNSKVVEVYCQIFDAGADSLPSGTPQRSDTLYIDSTFGGGLLSVLLQRAVFATPYKTSKPFILVVSTNDTNRVAVVTNSYANRDGDNEDLACGTVGGRWYKASNLNIGGTPLDCDILLEPHVSYKVFNDFSFKDCYNFNDTVKFKNESSPFYFNPMYNRYNFFDLDQYCHRWDYYGTGGSQYMKEGIVKYSAPGNYKIRLISTSYHFRGGGTCIDTTYKDLSYQPSDIQFSGDKNICSGNYGFLNALTTGNVNWYRSPTDTMPFRTVKNYASANPLYKNDTLYAKAVNRNCESKLRMYIIEVTTTPDVPTVTHDSICLNSLANLVASTNAGIIRWFTDSITPAPIYTGDVLQIGPLNRDTFFFVQAFNGSCTHNGRVRVNALVSSAFAPQEPVVSNDTTVCMLTPPFERYARSSNTLRWYDKAAGGSIIKTGDTFTYNPNKRGDFKIYVDAYDGNCASSRLPISIRVNHFPTLTDLADKMACAGDTVLVDFSSVHGSINWYDAPVLGNTVYSGKMRSFNSISATEIFYLEPYEGLCRDSVRHSITIESIPYAAILNKQLDAKACDGNIPTLEVQTDMGTTQWYDMTGTNLLFEGDRLTLAPVTKDVEVQYVLNHRGCKSVPALHQVVWLPVPDANFDYQVTWKNVQLSSRLIGQGSYVWTFGDGPDTLMGYDVKHFYKQDGNYDITLVVKSPDGCSDTVIKKISINTVGVKDLNAHSIRVYPNPLVTSALFIDSGVNWETFELISTSGKIVVRGVVTEDGGKASIQLSDLPEGLYVLRLMSGTDVVHTPIIKAAP